MWETITPTDIERAKQAWQKTRDRILERHQAEIKALEMDANLLRGLEVGCAAFHQRFKTPQIPQLGSPATPVAPADTNERSPEKQTVIELPTSPAPVLGDFGPNFGKRE